MQKRVKIKICKTCKAVRAGKNNKNNMTHLENEVKLDALTNQDQLTNLRIAQEYSDFLGASYKNSIFLEKISSVEVRFKSKPLYLILGIVSFIAGISLMSNYNTREIGNALLIIGIVLIVIFFFTRKHVVSITPDGGNSIDITAKGVNESRIEEYLTNIHEAKFARTSNIGK